MTIDRALFIGCLEVCRLQYCRYYYCTVGSTGATGPRDKKRLCLCGKERQREGVVSCMDWQTRHRVMMMYSEYHSADGMGVPV